MLNKMKAGAQIGSYSVAQTFQVKENVEVLKVQFFLPFLGQYFLLQYMSWMGRGWIISTVTCFFAYGYFAYRNFKQNLKHNNFFQFWSNRFRWKSSTWIQRLWNICCPVTFSFLIVKKWSKISEMLPPSIRSVSQGTHTFSDSFKS